MNENPPPPPPPTAASQSGGRQPSPPRPMPREAKVKAAAENPPIGRQSTPPRPMPEGANVNAAAVIPLIATPGLRTRPASSTRTRIEWKPPATAEHVQELIDAVAGLGQQIQALQFAVDRIEVKLDLD